MLLTFVSTTRSNVQTLVINTDAAFHGRAVLIELHIGVIIFLIKRFSILLMGVSSILGVYRYMLFVLVE